MCADDGDGSTVMSSLKTQPGKAINYAIVTRGSNPERNFYSPLTYCLSRKAYVFMQSEILGDECVLQLLLVIN
jgi:hypothetical protein